METLIVPTPEELEQAREIATRALEAWRTLQQASERETKQALVGKCFTLAEGLRADPSVTWPVYLAVTSLHNDRLMGWHFQSVPTGQLEVGLDENLEPAFLADRGTEIDRATFVVAFNELLTAVARFAGRMP